MHRQVRAFAMPGRGLPEFREKARQVARAGIYDLRAHHDDVLLTILFRHWRLDQLAGLTDQAEQARDGILTYLAKLDATAKRYEEEASRRRHRLNGLMEGLKAGRPVVIYGKTANRSRSPG
jgi:acyl-[acyl-carrier-protein] desaturase